MDSSATFSPATIDPTHSAKGAADRFLTACANDAFRHRAVRHPYLQALSDGGLPDPRWAMRDFAIQYSGYSAHFPRYLTRVISLLDDPGHRASLLSNLAEESGVYSEADLVSLRQAGVEPVWIEGIPHPELFRRFCRAAGAAGEEPEEASEVACWRQMFLGVLSEGAGQAIGALGLGTEEVVEPIYRQLLPALARAGIEGSDAAFFHVHTVVDDQHGEILREIARSFSETPAGRLALETGMKKAGRA